MVMLLIKELASMQSSLQTKDIPQYNDFENRPAKKINGRFFIF